VGDKSAQENTKQIHFIQRAQLSCLPFKIELQTTERMYLVYKLKTVAMISLLIKQSFKEQHGLNKSGII